jgi:hypothetical protein
MNASATIRDMQAAGVSRDAILGALVAAGKTRAQARSLMSVVKPRTREELRLRLAPDVRRQLTLDAQDRGMSAGELAAAILVAVISNDGIAHVLDEAAE